MAMALLLLQTDRAPIVLTPRPQGRERQKSPFSVAIVFWVVYLMQGPMLYLPITAAIVNQLAPSTLFHQRLNFGAVSTDLVL